MFLQIHMLQSMPPGNPNRDDTGQPKKCIFGRVTRARISSQCLKRNIRKYFESESAFGKDKLAVRTTWLPRMVAEELKKLKPDIPEEELDKIKAVLTKQFKSEKKVATREATEEGGQVQSGAQTAEPEDGAGDRTGQLVFFPPQFATDAARLITTFMEEHAPAYKEWIAAEGKQARKPEKAESKELKKEQKKLRDEIKQFEHDVAKSSETLTVDIAMFGRMTTSDLLVNREAACQVAHAISTHEAIIETDWFTAMDDMNERFEPSQAKRAAAGFMGTGEERTFFDSAVYYKYLNLDVGTLKKHLLWRDEQAEHAARLLLEAAAGASPTGKQNAFANHGAHELILVEVSDKRYPISYANAFLEPVKGDNLMAESAKALAWYLSSVGGAFSPTDTRRALLAVGSAAIDIKGAKRVDTFPALLDSFGELMGGKAATA